MRAFGGARAFPESPFTPPAARGRLTIAIAFRVGADDPFARGGNWEDSSPAPQASRTQSSFSPAVEEYRVQSPCSALSGPGRPSPPRREYPHPRRRRLRGV